MKKKKKSSRIAIAYLLDVALIGVGLLIFAMFHHAIPRVITQDEPYKTTAPQQQNTPAPTQSDSSMQTPVPEQTATIGWYYEGFTSGEIVKTDTTYASGNVYISITKHNENDVTYFVTDIHIRSMDCLQTAFATGTYGMGFTDSVLNIANENNAICAISGDYYGARDYGTVLRNGTLYRSERGASMCALYLDGTMKTFKYDTNNLFDIEYEMDNGAVQAWYFGPALLDENSQAIVGFTNKIRGRNPRSVLGYYEPGHYCFITVDGRREGYSVGMTLDELSQLVYSLGCTQAYNLDGGESANLVFDARVYNLPAGKGNRKLSDIVYICEPEG